MKIEYKQTEKEYPYLAYWSGGEPTSVSLEKDFIVLISMIDGKIYKQLLNGSKEGSFTEHEDEYTPLSKGYQITITQ
jgi:hypothetical protein